ncbi:dipeptidyl peptidase 1 isoform X1 [Ixodes scapularis]|uniref:dipeptidyl peptidase 1 isoform X1 n=1 Tax=Ixodes scapularis TaxID=6945 RepID=UPI001A9D192A|nr:dipeptidyl peptidase 1 isoform X1 [Ixodes scapularis]
MFTVPAFLLLLPLCLGLVAADTPSNCTYEDIRGWWTFVEGPRTGTKDVRCDNWKSEVAGGETRKVRLLLDFPNLVTDSDGNVGTWTLIYNQGFEVTLQYRRYFAFSNYTDDGHGRVVSYCGSTKVGWSHDVLGHNWACFEGRKDDGLGEKPLQVGRHEELGATRDPYNTEVFAQLINAAQNSWKAKVHPQFKEKTLDEMMMLRGGHRNKHLRSPGAAKVTEEQRREAQALPEEFDWRNVSGVNYVSPVRNQASCGSCYSFASMAMLEARLRIATKNRVQKIFSPQDVVSCSPYSQGCEGGFPYLIGGKYGQDFGVVEESCNPYQGSDGPCKTNTTCPRHYVGNYRYVGGYYGGCNEELMRLALVHGGPVAVGFEVYPDFQMYQGGVYRHTGVHRSLNLGSPFDPFELTNHAVLVTGYGVDKETGLKYWSVKNSWGPGWGENGYFRILRGTDECGIESLAVEASPIP